jgi:hypothetical protein
MVADFRGGSSRHDLHLLGVVRPVNEMIRATVVRELLGDLLCGVPRRDGVRIKHPAEVPDLRLYKDYRSLDPWGGLPL